MSRTRVYDVWVSLRHDLGSTWTVRLDTVTTSETLARRRGESEACEGMDVTVTGSVAVARPRGFFAGRVREGALVLDRMRPGWADGIDLSTLDLGHEDHCVLAHLWGNYWDGVDRLELPYLDQQVYRYGFVYELSSDEYRVLDRLWRHVIRARQAAMVPA